MRFMCMHTVFEENTLKLIHANLFKITEIVHAINSDSKVHVCTCITALWERNLKPIPLFGAKIGL